MELKDRVVVITERNMNGIYDLYGKVTINELEGIVNRYLAVAIEEIKEDEVEKFNG